MADREWAVSKDGNSLTYTLRLGSGGGTLTVKQKPGTGTVYPEWGINHQEVEIMTYTDLTAALDYCNTLATTMGQ